MPRQIRLLTGNVLKNRADPDHLAGLLERVDPDLVFLQEMGEGPGRVLKERFQHHFLFPSEEYEGRGVASRYEAELGSLELPWRPGTYVRLDLDGWTLAAAGAHMSNPIDFPQWRSLRERWHQTDALLAWAEEQDSEGLVLCGDMNATPAWPLYRRIAARYRDLAVEAADRSGESPEPTWSHRPGWPRMLRVDHVFGRGVEALAVEVHRIRGSDHHAVTVDLAPAPPIA